MLLCTPRHSHRAGTKEESVADRFTHNLYQIYVAEKGVYVSRSTDGGDNWTVTQVYQGSQRISYIFPTLAADPSSGKLYAAWSNGHTVSLSTSSDRGVTWSAPVSVNAAPATTAVFPWIAARNGTVDVVYYGTNGSSINDSSAVWNAYLAQTTNDGATFQQSRVSNTPNHVGVVCAGGISCTWANRTLLDLFQVAIDPTTGRAAVIYTDDTFTTDSTGAPVPQLVLAQQQ